MWRLFASRAQQKVAMRLHVDLGFQHGRLAGLVQLLVQANVTVTDL
jgi:hypothetical protein